MTKNFIKNVGLTLASIFILLIISEILLRIYYPPLESGWGWNNSPRRYLAKFENDDPNQLGLRGQGIKYNDNDFVILLLGDSQVESATSSPELMPEIFLENTLNNLVTKKTKVFSISASGWGQDQQLLALKKYFENYRADLVLIWATPKNDFWENGFPDRNLGKNAGHLKPSFIYKNNSLIGPYFENNFFYKELALVHLVYKTLQNFNDQTLEQLVLEDWNSLIPAPHNIEQNSIKFKPNEILEIDLDKFSEKLFSFYDSKSISILTYENFIDSRSHFSPYLINKSPRDYYLIDITKRLYTEIENLTFSKKSEFLVFYPIREDFDNITPTKVKFVKNYRFKDLYFPVNLNYLEMLKQVVTNSKLYAFEIEGKDEICVDRKDRHLNELGNKLVFENLAKYISQKYLFNFQKNDGIFHL